jgi:dephospho-CoA kinase
MPENDKPIIGLTGGIGSGKSEVSKILAELGCVVADSDSMARQVLKEKDVIDEIVRWWGHRVLDDAWQVNRAAVAAIVFNDPEERKKLEGLVHPRVEAMRRKQFAAAPARSPALVIDAPLLVEAGLDADCDSVWFVDCPREKRLERVHRQRGWDEQEFARREESQMPLDEKRSRADYVVANDGDRHHLADQVRRFLNEILEARRSS